MHISGHLENWIVGFFFFFTPTEWACWLNKETNYQFNGDLGQSKDLTEKYIKTFSDKQKTPSELIKEKKLNKNDYEADPPLIWGF